MRDLCETRMSLRSSGLRFLMVAITDMKSRHR
jgi:hypothetical protein